MNADEADISTLVRRVVRGESGGYLHLVRRFELGLRSYLACQVYCSADVDDLAQEVFIAAYRDLKSFREGEDFGSWLRGIARNRLLTYFRSQRRRTGALERFQQEAACVLAGEVEASFQGEGGERMERLLGCISKLPDRLRRVVRSGLREEKPALLAEELGTSVAAIYQMHYRAGKMLRECLGTGASF